ncbi:MGAT1 [Branchiostoma lanceolatum]|uniref:Alpha-1,3-mannosyl-glycoprotein 2-beta-N-acetylglucosaminyltransferase n=1 Tax=Branchiostoma lanceolatum TaxID=7740 RepID=A0A8K0EGC0_BRALA|nr:MGAT1 [Branchiostoma lanceolatum]
MTKRRRIVLWGAIVFLAWNILTFFVVHRPSSDQQVPSDLLKKLEALQSEVQRQMNNNEGLLRDLKKQKDLLNRYRNGNTGVQMDQGGRMNNSAQITHRLQSPAGDTVIPVLVIACNRPTVRRSLDLLVKHRPSAHQFPIIVSQDCGHQETSAVIKSYGDKIAHYIQQPDLSDIPVPPNHKRLQGYYKISRHYKWALNQVFNNLGYGSVLIVEDDLDIAPDFFDYFLSTLPVLQQDSSLWCVSAWNDNGKEHMTDTNRQDLLYRTDFFPGLGWMMLKNIWDELEPKWPASFWDDWMRHPDQRKDRACIRPEICRTSTFGRVGVSKGQYFDKHLKFIKLNTKPFDFTHTDLSYLLKDNYDRRFISEVYRSPQLTVKEVIANQHSEHNVVRVQYKTKEEFKGFAKQLGIMDDLKAGVPRAGYHGIVSFMFKGRRVHLSPPADWTQYDPSWS